MSLSIRNMNFTLQFMEHERDRKNHEWYMSLPADVRANRSHYWFLERKAKRGKKWIFVRDIVATKSEVAVLFVKHFRTPNRQYRLRHLLAY